MSDTITATATSINSIGTVQATPIAEIHVGTSTVSICSGLDYCPYRKNIEEKVRKQMNKEMFSEHPQPRYGGAFYSLDENGKTTLIYLKKVIYNAPATIAFWSDDTKTICKCDPRDKYDPEKGLLLCQMKKMYGGELVHKLLEDWAISYNHRIVTLADVRRKHR